VLLTEIPKFYLIATADKYGALAMPNLPTIASTRWWLITHLLTALSFVTCYHLFLIEYFRNGEADMLLEKEGDRPRIMKIANKAFLLCASTVICNMTNSTNLNPIKAFSFNLVGLSLFVIPWSLIYNIRNNWKKMVYLYWFLILIPTLAQIGATVYFSCCFTTPTGLEGPSAVGPTTLS
jgi:uncharacterized membrane protein